MKAGIIGLGARSTAYLPLIGMLPGSGVTAVCDVDEARLNHYIRVLMDDSPPQLATVDSGELIRSSEVDTVIICTPDSSHLAILKEAAAAGKHILLEKPVATTIEDARAIYDIGRNYDKALAIGFVLRYTPMYTKIHEVVGAGLLGEIVSISAKEILDTNHAGSFYRRWNRFHAMTGGLMNTKCCHDLDIINWIVSSEAQSLSAFGGRRFFNPVEGTAERCGECPMYNTCNYAFDDVQEKQSRKGITSLSDLCVFRSDKDIVDHEIMNIQYENGVVAQFELCMFGAEETRTMTIFGTKATLQADFVRSSVHISPLKGQRVACPVTGMQGGHGGGDRRLIEELYRAEEEGAPLNFTRAGYLSTAMALAGEESMAAGGEAVCIRNFAGTI